MFTLLVSERCRNAAKKIEMYTHKRDIDKSSKKVPHKLKELSQIVLSASFRRQIVEIVQLVVRADKRMLVVVAMSHIGLCAFLRIVESQWTLG